MQPTKKANHAFGSVNLANQIFLNNKTCTIYVFPLFDSIKLSFKRQEWQGYYKHICQKMCGDQIKRSARLFLSYFSVTLDSSNSS